MRGFIAAVVLAVGMSGQMMAQDAIQFTNGQWFDGRGFKKGTVYSMGGMLTFKKPAATFQTVDLQGGWVVAPFGGLGLEAPLPAAQYLTDGVQYLMRFDAPERGDVPRSIDVARALSVAPQAGGLDQAWAQTMAAKPDVIQVETSTPQLLDVMRRAVAEKVRVAARVDSLTEFRAAVALNVDIIAGLPDERLTVFDAEQASRRRILVVSTPSGSPEVQAANLRLLKAARAEQGVGGGTNEALRLHSLGVLTNRELLKSWTEITPRAIFPTRRIGYLREGYEASFVVLRRNPLKDFAGAVQDIAVVYKQGRRLTL